MQQYQSTETLIVYSLIYFMPSIIALLRNGSASVFVINLFLGWTFIGWVIALAMSVGRKPA